MSQCNTLGLRTEETSLQQALVFEVAVAPTKYRYCTSQSWIHEWISGDQGKYSLIHKSTILSECWGQLMCAAFLGVSVRCHFLYVFCRRSHRLIDDDEDILVDGLFHIKGQIVH